jgi:hypothetical protein
MEGSVKKLYDLGFDNLKQAISIDKTSLWSCGSCTYLNYHELSVCEMCDRARPPKGAYGNVCSAQAEFHYIEAAFYFFQARSGETDEKSKFLVAEEVAGYLALCSSINMKTGFIKRPVTPQQSHGEANVEFLLTLAAFFFSQALGCEEASKSNTRGQTSRLLFIATKFYRSSVFQYLAALEKFRDLQDPMIKQRLGPSVERIKHRISASLDRIVLLKKKAGFNERGIFANPNRSGIDLKKAEKIAVTQSNGVSDLKHSNDGGFEFEQTDTLHAFAGIVQAFEEEVRRDRPNASTNYSSIRDCKHALLDSGLEKTESVLQLERLPSIESNMPGPPMIESDLDEKDAKIEDHVEVIKEYSSADDTQLTLVMGDIITVEEKHESGWW